jgi:hypothetical protein
LSAERLVWARAHGWVADQHAEALWEAVNQSVSLFSCLGSLLTGLKAVILPGWAET